MTRTFNAQRGVIVVQARVWGPLGYASAELILDTGATFTLVNPAILRAVGYEPQRAPDRQYIITASATEFVPRLTVTRLTALGKNVANFPILCHSLPPTSQVHGVLGLDFFRNRRLTLDFRRSTITLT